MRRSEGRLRKDLGLRGTIDPGRVIALALEAGFHRAGFVDVNLLPLPGERLRDRLRGHELELEWITSPASWAASAAILVCCLSCYRNEPDDLSAPGDPHALVAPFARANYYRAAAGMLRSLASRLEREYGVPKRSVRVFTNSRIPEKPLLEASGLGAIGKNGLAIVPGLGSLFIIAGAIIPVPSSELVPAALHAAPDPCGACDRCLRSCPVSAFAAPRVLDPALCLQGCATSPDPLESVVMEKWGVRLYGCQECQACCPHNRELEETARPAAGDVGPSVSIREFLSMDSDTLKGRLHGTAMGMSWIGSNALLRNALMAAGNRRDTALRPQVTLYCESEVPMLRRAAQWALDRL